MDYPGVSCFCTSFGRLEMLNEAVESFLRQDYEGEKELVIINDCPNITLGPGDLPIRVFNFPERFKTLGDKFNMAVKLCGHDILCPWDDDDLSLPTRLSFSVKGMGEDRYFKPDKCYTTNKLTTGIVYEPKVGNYHGMSAFKKSLWSDIKGYELIYSSLDLAFEQAIEAKGEYKTSIIEIKDIYFIYRYGIGEYNLSNRQSTDKEKDYNDLLEIVMAKYPKGDYYIKPGWKADYEAIAEDMARCLVI